jgi:hypothetical protein
MKIYKLVFGVAPIVLLACDGNAPTEPELSPGPETMVTQGYYHDYSYYHDYGGYNCWEPHEEFLDGRMTGGGVVRLQGDVKITHGFTLHCDERLSNNLEINWEGNQWHINPKGVLEDVACTDDPSITEEPPPAPFDTFCATAMGLYNGEEGYQIEFCLQDAGEPGGKMDMASMSITGSSGPVLTVLWDYTVSGNLQAHYDQPHK